MKISIFVLKFLFIGALFIVSNENLYLKNPADLESFSNLFLSWLQALTDKVLEITGYVINSEWLPQNDPVELAG